MNNPTKIIDMTNRLFFMHFAAHTHDVSQDEMDAKWHEFNAKAKAIYNKYAGMGKEARINVLVQYNLASANLALSQQNKDDYRAEVDALILFMEQSEIDEAIKKQKAVKEQLAWINKEPTSYEL